MADKEHRQTDEILAEMEQHLSAIYEEASADIEAKAQEYFDRFKAQDEEMRKKVKSGEITEAEYIEWRRKKMLYGKRYTDMQRSLAEEISHVNETAMAYINDKLPTIYALNFNALKGAVESVVRGYSFSLVDPQVVKNLATRDKTLLPYKYVNGRKDVRWNTQKVNSAVLQGVLQGESVSDIGKRLQSVTEMNRTSAIRNARTTVTSAECKGRQDSYEQAQKDGIEIEREWIATNDMRTRHAHAFLNGKTAAVDKPFETPLQIGANKFITDRIMYPGDPEAHPANVYNCRCTIAAKVIGFNKAQAQKKDDDANNLPQKPIRPKKKDYGTEEEYLKAREKYKADKQEYEKKISDVVNSNLSRKRKYESVESLKNWAKRKGIKVDDSIGMVDIRAFDDYIRTTDKLFSKYPQVLRWYREQGYSYTLDTIGDAGTLASAGHGFSFGRLFSNYENVLQEYLEAITSGSQVRGDGTIAGLFRHEFGHELDNTIRMSIYGDLEKRKAYMSDIRGLYGKSGMSEYATVNEDEMFAEAFAEYESGSDSEFAKAFEKLIGRWLK